MQEGKRPISASASNDLRQGHPVEDDSRQTSGPHEEPEEGGTTKHHTSKLNLSGYRDTDNRENNHIEIVSIL